MNEIEEIYPQVTVYRNALKEPELFLSAITEGSPDIQAWDSWYTLGRQTMINGYQHYFGDTFPNQEQWDQSRNDTENYVSRITANAFYASTKDYVDRHQITMQNWSHSPPTINTHTAQPANGKLAMQHHTDFVMSTPEWPGYKHWLTCNIYINDNYEGGGLSFKVFTTETEYDHFSYKPSAGDALVFPSHHPYYHGVKRTLAGEKFFIRTFWGYEYEGSETYNRNKQELGEEWIKSEEQRSYDENNGSKWMKGYVDED